MTLLALRTGILRIGNLRIGILRIGILWIGILWIGIHWAWAGQAGDRTTISREALTDSVRAGIVRHLDPLLETLVEVYDLPEGIEVLREGVTVRVDAPWNQRPRGSMRASVEVAAAERVLRLISVRVVVRTFGDVLVAEKRLDRHAVVAEGDVVVQRTETTRFADEPMMRTAQLHGMRLKRMVRPGTLLVQTMFEPVPLVVMGREVNIVVTAGGVRVATAGVAREDGARGDLITVRPKGRREWVRGRVVDATTVEMVIF